MFTKLKNNKAQNKIKLKNIENFFSKKIGCPVNYFHLEDLVWGLY